MWEILSTIDGLIAAPLLTLMVCTICMDILLTLLHYHIIWLYQFKKMDELKWFIFCCGYEYTVARVTAPSTLQSIAPSIAPSTLPSKAPYLHLNYNSIHCSIKCSYPILLFNEYRFLFNSNSISLLKSFITSTLSLGIHISPF
jgi:hypothetical protein